MTWYQKTRWTSAKKTEVMGKRYDSKFEAGYGFELEMRKKAGEIEDFKTHVPIKLIWNDIKISTYYIDFEVHHLDGTIEYVETKGWQTDIWKMKWRCLEAMTKDDPNITMTLIQQPTWKNKRGYINGN